jgi:transporter family protein
MKPWILCAFLSMFFAGVTAVLAKAGLSGITAELGIVVRTCLVFVLVWLFAALAVSPQDWHALTAHHWFWLGLSALTTTLSWIFYYLALKQGDVTTVALIDKGSILVTVLLAACFLKEHLTFRMMLGGLLVLSGMLVLAKKS